MNMKYGLALAIAPFLFSAASNASNSTPQQELCFRIFNDRLIGGDIFDNPTKPDPSLIIKFLLANNDDSREHYPLNQAIRWYMEVEAPQHLDLLSVIRTLLENKTGADPLKQFVTKQKNQQTNALSCVLRSIFTYYSGIRSYEKPQVTLSSLRGIARLLPLVSELWKYCDKKQVKLPSSDIKGLSYLITKGTETSKHILYACKIEEAEKQHLLSGCVTQSDKVTSAVDTLDKSNAKKVIVSNADEMASAYCQVLTEIYNHRKGVLI